MRRVRRCDVRAGGIKILLTELLTGQQFGILFLQDFHREQM